MRIRVVVKHLGVVVILLMTMVAGIARPVLADVMPKVALTPSPITLNEGQSQAVSIILSEPIITQVPTDGYVFVDVTASNSSRLSVDIPSTYYAYNEWGQHKTFTVQANDDDKVNGDAVVTLSYHIYSNSEFYDGYENSITVNVRDNDVAPQVTSPAAGQATPAGSLMITGTATAGQEVGIKLDGVVVGQATADESGDWSLLVPKVSAGSHTILAQTQTRHHYAFMANAYSGSIDVVDLDDQRFAQEIPDTGSVDATYNTYNNLLYSASNVDGNCRIAVYDPVTYQQTATIAHASNCNAFSLTLSPDGKRGYLLLSEDNVDNQIMVADLTTNTIITEYTLPELNQQYPSGVTITPDGSQVWIRTVNGIERFTAGAGTHLGSIVLGDLAGSYRQNIVFNSSGTRAYTSDSAAGVVYVINVSDNSLIHTIVTGEGSNMVALTPDGSKLFVAASYPSSAIYVLDIATNQLVQTEEVPTNLPPESLAFSPDGQWVVGDDHGSGAIFFGNANSGASVQKTIYAPSGGSYYTSIGNFASPPLVSVLGVSTTVAFNAVAYTVPNTGLPRAL